MANAKTNEDWKENINYGRNDENIGANPKLLSEIISGDKALRIEISERCDKDYLYDEDCSGE